MSRPRSRKNEEIRFLAGEACLYTVVKKSAQALGWTLIGEDAPEKVKRNCHVIWVDRSFVSDKLFLSIQPWQRINHFPGMTNICRKTRLAQSLELMKKKFPREFSFYPATYVLPQNFAAFKNVFAPSGRSKAAYIIKPDGSAQGKGIFLTKRIEDVENLSMMCVAQQYIRDPLLIDKKKFDLRIYVLTTSCSPLRIYLFRDGLVRICTEEYNRPNTSNMDDMCMHLTNYAVNKRSEKYERDGGSTPSNLGSKRSISWLLAWLSKERGEASAAEMWSKIRDICVMTIISILPTLRREYNSIFGKAKGSSHMGSSNSSERHSSPAPSPETSGSCQMKGGNGESLRQSTPASGGDGLEADGNSQCDDETDQKPASNNTQQRDSVGRSCCFEILGFDIMIDNNLRPYLIEVNHLPSWATDSPLDEQIKSRVIVQALSAMKVRAQDKRQHERLERKNSKSRLRKQPSDTSHSGAKDTHSQKRFSRDIDDSSGANKRQPILFDSNSAVRRIRSTYEKYAPEKLSKVNDLLIRYRGYEEWLAMKVEEKYCQQSSRSDSDDDGSSIGSDDSDDGRKTDHSNISCGATNGTEFDEEVKILEDYDLIYPPSNKSRIHSSRYKEMENFVTEMDAKQQRRLTCPLQQMKPNKEGEDEIINNNSNLHARSSRGDGWIGGNIHIRPMGEGRQGAKIVVPPSKKQIEAADRLNRGYSVENTATSENRKYRINQRDFYDRDNPFYQLIDRVRHSRDLSKEARKRAELKLSKRLLTGTALKPQTLSLVGLGFDSPLDAGNSLRPQTVSRGMGVDALKAAPSRQRTNPIKNDSFFRNSNK